MLKMMRNMAANSSEDKYKRIRLGNANFNSKVGGIDGGLEVSQSSQVSARDMFLWSCSSRSCVLCTVVYVRVFSIDVLID